jgi:hypothetical protein
MALYMYEQFLRKATPHKEFDTLYSPGNRTSWSGIYRCEACGKEVVHTHDKPLPPQNHHTHPSSLKPIQWRLIVTDYDA